MIVDYAEIVIGPTAASIAAGTSADMYIQFNAPGKWMIERVRFLPEIAVTADGTNYTVYTLTNATQTQTIGARSYAATNSVAGTPETVTTPTGLAAVVSQGDVLKLAVASAGTGVASRSRFVVSLKRADLP